MSDVRVAYGALTTGTPASKSKHVLQHGRYCTTVPHSKTSGILLVELVYIHTNFAGHSDGLPVLVEAKTLPAFGVHDKD